MAGAEADLSVIKDIKRNKDRIDAEANGRIKGAEALVHEFGSKAEAYTALMWGNVAGSLGETSAILILIGGVFLLIKRY